MEPERGGRERERGAREKERGRKREMGVCVCEKVTDKMRERDSEG